MTEFKVWKAGSGSYVITIPKWLRTLRNIKERDKLFIDINNIHQTDETEVKQ